MKRAINVRVSSRPEVTQLRVQCTIKNAQKEIMPQAVSTGHIRLSQAIKSDLIWFAYFLDTEGLAISK